MNTHQRKSLVLFQDVADPEILYRMLLTPVSSPTSCVLLRTFYGVLTVSAQTVNSYAGHVYTK